MANVGRLAQSMSSGQLEAYESAHGPVIIMCGSMDVAFPWFHPLPEKASNDA